MRHCCRILIAPALLWSICAHGEMRLQPFIVHDVGRSAEVAIEVLRTSVHWNTIITNIALYQKWSVANTETFLNTRALDTHALNTLAWTTCSHSGWFASDGVYRRVDGSWHVGTIVRKSEPGEQFVCVNKKPVISSMCGNPVRITYTEEESPPPACRNTGVEHGSVVVSSMGMATQTTWEFTPFECHFK